MLINIYLRRILFRLTLSIYTPGLQAEYKAPSYRQKKIKCISLENCTSRTCPSKSNEEFETSKLAKRNKNTEPSTLCNNTLIKFSS